MKKLFLPPGSKVVGNQVTLSSGDVVPKWVLIGVPAHKASAPVKQSGTGREPSGVYVDVVTGATTTNPPPVGDPIPAASRQGKYDFSTFSRFVPREKFNALVRDTLPKPAADETSVELDAGYYEQVDATARPTFAVDETVATPIDDSTSLGSGYVLRDALVWEGRPQELVAQHSKSKSDAVVAMRRIVVNVLDRLDATNDYREGYEVVLGWKVRSWFVDDNYWTPDPESHTGEAVRIEFDGSREEVYKKAVDLATKLSFDRLYLDYRSDGRTIVTVVAPNGATARKVATRYDDVLVSDNRLICASGSSDVEEDRPLTVQETLAEVQPDAKDDYYSLYIAIKNNPEIFGGLAAAQKLLLTLGFPANPTLSGRSGFSSTAGSAASSVSRELMGQLASVIQCPATAISQKMFPTSSHAGFRGMSDKTQLDDGRTQDTIPYTVRTNNPLKVKTVKGVTDLKDRFGYLGESSDGTAVYRDHVGGAAAGLAYLLSMGGSTVATAARSVLGQVGGTDDSSDVTAVTMAKVMQGLGQGLFGIPDPSGAIQECATITDDLEGLIGTAASMAASLLGGDRSPLTKNEWQSAYQIAKNESGGGVTKSSTGLSLPVTERQDNAVQQTGSRTESQGKDAPHSVDENKATTEKWNPIANYAHYAQNVWQSWVSSNTVKYEQKSSSSDTSKIGKKTDTEKLDQNPKTYSTSTTIES